MVTEINGEDSSMKDTFNIDDMALITGLSTRTIRGYIADGFLDGGKSSGARRFTAEQVYRKSQKPPARAGGFAVAGIDLLRARADLPCRRRRIPFLNMEKHRKGLAKS